MCPLLYNIQLHLLLNCLYDFLKLKTFSQITHFVKLVLPEKNSKSTPKISKQTETKLKNRKPDIIYKIKH